MICEMSDFIDPCPTTVTPKEKLTIFNSVFDESGFTAIVDSNYI